tara:strand:+ start:6326 stop:7453 length:1128 start_codon:yes stop_codon:yes gene_type:complete
MSLSNTVSALTRDKFMPILVDNIFNSNVLCFKLLKNAELLDGGAKIITPIEYAENGNSGWVKPNAGTTYDGSSYVALGQAMTEVAQKAEWNWATGYNNVVLSGEEQFVNSGASQVLSILKARMANAEKTFKDLIGDGLFASDAVQDGLTTLNGAGVVASSDYTTASELIDTPASDTSLFHAPGNKDNAVCGYNRSLGGIDSDSQAWWDAKLGTFSTILADGANNVAPTFAEFTSTTDGVSKGVQKMTQMYGACTIDGDAPDMIVTTQVIYDAYESSLQGNKRFDGDASLGDAGFQSLRFKGASVVVDSHVPAGHMYFLNTKYLDFKVHSKRNFAMEDFKPLETKDAIQSRIFWMGQLVCTNPRMQGLLVGGPTGY